MERYEEPEIEIIFLENQDIITVSPEGNLDGDED